MSQTTPSSPSDSANRPEIETETNDAEASPPSKRKSSHAPADGTTGVPNVRSNLVANMRLRDVREKN